ncbi:MAG: histidine phosphatase family protein [Pseudomonadota bacterium]
MPLRSIWLLAAALGVATTGTAGATEASPDELVEALKGGGLVAYVRHAKTERDYADQVSADPTNCSTQRTLSEIGWVEAKTIGAGFRAHEIPVGEVISSQYCRAWQTADLAFGEYVQNAALNFEPAEEYTPEQVEAMRSRVLPILTAPVEAGTNRIVVGHDDPFEAVTGIYPEPMGVTFVLRPDGDTIEVLGHIPPEYWQSANP